MNTRRIQQETLLLSPGSLALFEASNERLRKEGEEECSVAEFLATCINQAVEEAERVASKSAVGAYCVKKILVILRGNP